MIRRMLSIQQQHQQQQQQNNNHHHRPYILPISILLLLLPILLLLFHFPPPHFLSPPRQLPIPPSSELSDLTLFSRAISAVTPTAKLRFSTHNPTFKIAFLFLTNSDLFFSPLWSRFFNTSDHRQPPLYNIYIHADPDIRVSDPGGVFSGRFIPSKHTERSSATLISAARRLIAHAILDDSMNFYFALVSQSCIPLHSFDYVYRTIFNLPNHRILPDFASALLAGFRPEEKPKSFIEILANESTLPSRYVARGEDAMLPEVPYEKFRVGSQFFVLNKKHAVMVLRERKLWRKFRLPCNRIESCYPEEHYFPTYLEMVDPDRCTKYTVTRVNWTDSVDGHPHLYKPPEVSEELIHTLRKSNFSHDYLFARKFSPDCLKPLMDLADDVLFKD